MTHVVFLPGLNNDSEVWAPVIDALPADLPGTAYDLPALSALERIADELAPSVPPRSIIVGHSFGGVVAMTLVERHPGTAAGLVLVNTPADADEAEAAEARRARARQALDGAFEQMAMGRMDLVYHGQRAQDPEVHAARLRGVRAYGAERYFAHSLATADRPDRSKFLQTLGIPVLVLAASDDLVVPTAGQRQMAQANGVSYVEIPETGHMLPAEEPVALIAAIVSWWQGAAARHAEPEVGTTARGSLRVR